MADVITAHLSEFRQALRHKKLSARTIESYEQDVISFSTWYAAQNDSPTYLPTITENDIIDYRSFLQSSLDLAPSSINRRLTGLRVFFDWAVDHGTILNNPAAKVPGIKSEPPPPRWLTEAEQQQLLTALDEMVAKAATTNLQEQAVRDKAIILIVLHTGLNIQELRRLTTTSITLLYNEGTVQVKGETGKQSRQIPLNSQARQALGAYLKVRPHTTNNTLFVGKRGPLGNRQIQRILKHCARQAGLPEKLVTIHTLRHTLARNLVRAGVGLEQAAELLGFANLETMRRYLPANEFPLQDAVEKVAQARQ